MTKRLIFIVLVFMPFFNFCQEKGAISVEFNSSYRLFSMVEFNRAISLRRANSYSEANVTKTTNVENGYGHGLSLNFQLNKLVGMGLYSEYAKGSSVTEYNYIVGGENGVPIDTWYRVDNHDLHSLTLGLKTQFKVNKLDFWEKNSWLSRIESVIELGGGYGFSRADIYVTSPDKESVGVGSMKEFNRVSGVHFMVNFKLGLKISDQPLFSRIGIIVGYQYLKTNRLQGGEGIYHNYFFSTGNAPKLDFSGFSAGIYLTFGK